MMKTTVEQLIKEHGLCYLDTYVARHFAKLTGQREEDVLSILRRQEKLTIAEESGRGRWERARERSCMLLASGLDNEWHHPDNPTCFKLTGQKARPK